ncbi:MAG: sugar phosphate nucleotidyltransferase, partial [Candidatus Curtissbacteria bacterium]|nr:sugar phosphate nucleotidyltransferase [Candidatus Curtissbacteria bacterium]
LAEDVADGQSVAVILGDNCTDADISGEVKKFKNGAVIFLHQVDDPHRFGIAELDKRDKTKVVDIVEKPKNPKSNLAVTGVYIYDNQVFTFTKEIKPSARGQLEITDVNNLYIKEGNLHWAKLDGFWNDAGTFDSLYRTGVYWARKNLGSEKEKELTTF